MTRRRKTGQPIAAGALSVLIISFISLSFNFEMLYSEKNNGTYGKNDHTYGLKKRGKFLKGKTYEEIFGKKRAKEIKNKISKNLTGNKNGFYGKTHSQKLKDNMKKNNPMHNEDTRQKVRETCFKKYGVYSILQLEEVQKKSRISLTNYFKSNGLFLKLTKPHKIIKEEMIKKNLYNGFTSNYNERFYFIDEGNEELKIAIEVDGDYWHSNPKIYNKNNMNKMQIANFNHDKRKNTFLKNRNWLVLRFWESDIYDNLNKCMNKIERTIKMRKDNKEKGEIIC